MKINQLYSKFSSPKEAVIISAFFVLLALNSVLLTANALWKWPISSKTYGSYLLFIYFAFFILSIGLAIFFSGKKTETILNKFLWLFFIPAIILLYGISVSRNFSIFINLFVGFYWIALGLYLCYKRKPTWKTETKNEEAEKKTSNNGKIYWITVTLITVLYFLFGSYHIARFAAVDEPLWSFGRIPQYWHALAQRNWGNTLVSDKPGITVSILSGTGLLWENPQDYDTIFWQGRAYRSNPHIESLNFALRFPIVLLTALCLPLFYYFLFKLWGKKPAILALALIALSPVLIGISRIVNPDALLWAFGGLAMLAFLCYLKSREKRFIYFSGALLGLSLLTKYIANLFFIFFLGIIILEFLINREKYSYQSAKEYAIQSLKDYFLIVFCALATVYIFLPMIWIMPGEMLNVTIKSQAFASTWPIFAAIILFILFDAMLLKGRILDNVSNSAAKFKGTLIKIVLAVFIASILFVIFDVYNQMRFFNLEKIFLSPKASETNPLNENLLPIFFANFYPLVFGISPIALLSVLFFSSMMIKNKKYAQKNILAVYLIIFILLYYLGSAVNGVASIVRYQILVFPAILIIAGMGIYELIKLIKKTVAFSIAALVIIITLSFSLVKTFPFYLSYASDLLPKKYSLDLKDMGAGSYEAAQFLNSLPQPEAISVWTDKQGVCYFFKGLCYTGFDPEIKNVHMDYVVVSSGRENRTARMTRKKAPDFTRFYDERNNIVFELYINGRAGQFVKIIKN